MSTAPAPQDRARYRGFESVPIRITVVVGRAQLTLSKLLELAKCDLVKLDRGVGAPFDLITGELVLGRVDPVASDDGIAIKLVDAGSDDDAAP